MGKMIDALIGELEQEAATTRRVLERVPGDQLSWKPHPKSMTLGQLAHHVAWIPGAVVEFSSQPMAQEPGFQHPAAASTAELIPALEASVAKAKTLLGAMDDSALAATWRLMDGDQELMAIPRGAFLRSVMLNHWYHHRGQLLVYLRLLNQSVPSVYGPTADENPFAA